MATLTDKEVVLVNDMISDMYSHDDIYEMGKSFMVFMRRLVPYASGAFSLLDSEYPLHVPINKVVYIDSNPELINEYNEKYVSIDFTNQIFSYPKSATFTDRDIISDDEKKNNEFYNGWLKPNGYEYCGGIFIKTHKGDWGNVTIYRGKIHGNFTEKDTFILDLFVSHLENIISGFMDNQDKKQTTEDFIKVDEYDLLSKREQELIPYMLRRLSGEEISENLCISISTVKKHIHSIYAKLGVSNRKELIDLFTKVK